MKKLEHLVLLILAFLRYQPAKDELRSIRKLRSKR